MFLGAAIALALALAALAGCLVLLRRAREGASGHSSDAFERVFSASPIGMAVVGADGVVHRANQPMSDLLGGDRAGQRFDTLVSEGDRAGAREQLDRLVARELHAVTLRLGLHHADGSDVPAVLSVSLLRDDAGDPREYIVQARDETDNEALTAEVRHATDHDSLTGLLNRAALLPLLRELPGQPAALAILDVDGLSAINETCGTLAGDAVIEAVAGRLTATLSRRGALARIGGDEFGILISDVDAAAARALVEELVAAVCARPVDVAGERLVVTACAGVALEDDLLSNANEALQQAKREGHGTTVLFSSRMRERRTNGRDWADKVRRGLQSDRLLLDAQPIVDVLTGEPVQYELLLRMRDDDGSIVRPNAFLGAARRHGLMGAVDEWVVGQAIALVQGRAQQNAPVDIAVNLSPESIADRAFLARAISRLVDAPEAGRHLVFELTERSAMSDRGDALRLMARLGEFGCRFALDDFGAGSASLRYLKQLPVEFLKLDGQLTRGLPVDPADRAITAAVVGAAHGLGKTVVAECVEDAAILDAVRELGVELAQGLHVGRPQPAAEQLSVAAPS